MSEPRATPVVPNGPGAGGPPPGEVITFYSYKGGTGRSMLLANVAWHLAGIGKRVLLMDWDLEAPGLHRYFKPFLGSDPELREQIGVMQWLTDYWEACLDEPEAPVETLIRHYADPRNYVRKLDISAYVKDGCIDLMGPGRQDSRYAQAVADFDFTRLYQRLRGEEFIDTAKQILISDEGYDYVLVDSRTGVTDTSGFCTVALADTLVVCFTYNNQSVIGASQIARDIRRKAEARRDKQVSEGTARRFKLFALPCRVDDVDRTRLRAREHFAWGKFAEVLTDLPTDRPEWYWDAVKIRNHGFFAYEEVLAACMDRASDPQGVLHAVTQIAQALTATKAAPVDLSESDRKDLLAKYALQGPNEATAGRGSGGAPTAWSRLLEQMPEPGSRDALLQRCLPVLSQLVAPAPEGESGRPWVRTQIVESELTADERRMAETLTAARVTQRRVAEDGQRALVLADDSIAQNWAGLREHLHNERAFLITRQQVRAARHQWETSGRNLAQLLELQPKFADFAPNDEQRRCLGRLDLQFLTGMRDVKAREETATRIAQQLAASRHADSTRRLRVWLGSLAGLLVLIGALGSLYLHLQDARAKERVQDLEAQLVRERARAAGLQRESEWKIGALQQEVAEKDELIATMTASYSQLSLGDQNQLIVDALGKGIVDLTALDQRVAILLRTAAGQSEPDISFEVAARQLEKALSDRKTILKVNVVQPGIDGLRKLADARSRKQAATR